MVDTNFAVIDFETYYDKEYSLNKLQTDAYVLDPRFEIIGVSIKPPDSHKVEWFSAGTVAEYQEYLRGAFDWATTPVCAHNAHFDGFIATQVLGLRPRLWMDTLAMARTVQPWLRYFSLGKLAETFELPVGKGTYVQNALGKHRADFNAAELAAYGDYCKTDVILCYALALILRAKFTPTELVLSDMTTRMFTEPRLHGDVDVFRECYEAEIARKAALMAGTTADKDTIMSNPKFAKALRALGVAPPVKVSARTNKTTFAFAKTDKGLTDLLGHEDPQVQALVAARLGVKTTIAETRAERLLSAAERGPMPVYLNHWGAKVTGRLSGGNKINYQNIPARGDGAKLRKGLIAPPGHVIVVGDSSNIELRMAMMLAGEEEALYKIAQGVDMYADFASDIYSKPINAIDNPTERKLGKVGMLSLQYGTGDKTFCDMTRIQAPELALDQYTAREVVQLYRAKYRRLATLWAHCGRTVLPAILNRQLGTPVDVHGLFVTNRHGFSLPGEPGVCYKDLHMERDINGSAWRYTMGREQPFIHGAKVVENLCQHAARQVVMWQTARVHQRYPVSLSVHDEIVCAVPEEDGDACKEYMEESLALAPKWCHGKVALQGEVAIGPTYGDAK